MNATTITTRRRPSRIVRDSTGKPCRVRSRYSTDHEVVDIHDGFVFFVDAHTGMMYAITEQDI